MLFEKTYTATIDVRDPDNYCANPRLMVENHLRRLFVGRCFRGAFILEILGTVRLSPCMIKDTATCGSGGEGYVDVEFRARVSVLAQWDILTGVRVVAQTPMIVGHSVAEGAATVATLMPSAEARTVAVGQLVAMRVVQTRYNPYQEEASAVGVLLTCDKTAPVYAIEGPLSAADASALAPLAARVGRLLKARAGAYAARPDDFLFFEGLLYSYALPRDAGTQVVESGTGPAWTGPAGFPLPPGASPENLLDFVARASEGGADAGGLWSRDLAIPRSAPLAARAAPGSAPAGWPEAVATQPRAAFAAMLKSAHDFLQAVGELVGLYASPEDLTAHNNIWRAMLQARLPRP